MQASTVAIRFKMWKTGAIDILWGYFNGTWWVWIGPNYPNHHACPKFRWTRMWITHFDLDKCIWLTIPEKAGRNISKRIIGDPEELNYQFGHKMVRLDPYSEHCYLCRIIDEMKEDKKRATDEELDAILERTYQQCEVAIEVLSRNIDRKALTAKLRLGLMVYQLEAP